MNLTNKDELISYLQKHGLYTQHALGQNFLVDENALNNIIDAAELKTDHTVIEVGPGTGTMTGELIEKAGRVIAIELDQKLAKLLNESFGSNKNLTVVNQDILKVNISELIGEKKYKVVANIPYYITSKILQLFLTMNKKPESIVVLTQKEVAERICAKPGDMSVLSISVQAFGEPEIMGIVPRESFFPAPKVDSAILRIKNIHSFGGNDDCDEKEFFRLVHISFASRRKTLINNLAAGLHIDKKQALDIIKSIGFDENIRAQELSVDDWKRLVLALNK